MRTIAAAGVVGAPPAAVFAFLADLRNHWALTGEWVTLAALSGPDDGPTGGTVLVRGPLGVRRRARTTVLVASPVRELRGLAEVGTGTRARIRWAIAPDGAGARVTLEASVLDASLLDALLLEAGGRRWLARRFAETIRQLDRRLGPAAVASAPPRVLVEVA